MWTLLPSNVAGRTKKSVTSTILLIAYCAGNCIGAQVFQSKDAPMYIPAIVICAVMYAIEFILMAVWRFYCELSRVVIVVAYCGIESMLTGHVIQTYGRTGSERHSLLRWASARRNRCIKVVSMQSPT